MLKTVYLPVFSDSKEMAELGQLYRVTCVVSWVGFIIPLSKNNYQITKAAFMENVYLTARPVK